MKQTTIKKNLTSGIIAVVAGAILWFMLPYAIDAKVIVISAGIGPDYLPKIVIMIMIASGIGLVFQSLVLKKDETVVIVHSDELHALLYSIIIIGYVLILPFIGFILSSIIFSVLSLLIMESKHIKHFFIIVLLVIAVFIGFKYGLSVSLPTILL